MTPIPAHPGTMQSYVLAKKRQWLASRVVDLHSTHSHSLNPAKLPEADRQCLRESSLEIVAPVPLDTDLTFPTFPSVCLARVNSSVNETSMIKKTHLGD